MRRAATCEGASAHSPFEETDEDFCTLCGCVGKKDKGQDLLMASASPCLCSAIQKGRMGMRDAQYESGAVIFAIGDGRWAVVTF
jgi:hypothetical protein